MTANGRQAQVRRFGREVLFSGKYPEFCIRSIFITMTGATQKVVIYVGEGMMSPALHPLAIAYFGRTGYALVHQHEYARGTSTVDVGTGIRHPNVFGWGTLGGIFTRANDTHIYGLSNNHVIANLNHAQAGETIFHATQGEVGTLFNWLTLRESPGINYIDAALVRIDPRYLAQWNPPRPSTGQWMAPQMGMRVVKNGFTTPHITEGIITHEDGQGTTTFAGRTYHFSGIIQIQGLDGPFSRDGDSGSIVLSLPDYHMVGIIFAKVGVFSWALPISRIKPLLG